MHFDEKLLELISKIPAHKWEGEVFRHMFANFPPDHENTSGARWNAPEVPAIYTCLDRTVVIAEAEHQIHMQPLRPKARRTIYRIGVSLSNVLDISDPAVMKTLSLSTAVLQDLDMETCQMVGSSVERLGLDGLIVPSARAAGLNLVVFPNKRVEGKYRFDVLGAEVIDPGMSW